MSIVSPTSNTTEGRVAINIMSAEAATDKLYEHFKLVTIPGQDVTVDVQMTINGVPVDYSRSIIDLWERVKAHRDKEVLAKAKELISMTRFSKLNERLDDLEYAAIREIDALMSEDSK